mmetsp:Transcript_43277/g.138225  ORF Transcript_43277/g.138225 Transcript_43277/m.138225 type:complete len:317 (+) Transcript_43277:973-1923(+)
MTVIMGSSTHASKSSAAIGWSYNLPRCQTKSAVLPGSGVCLTWMDQKSSSTKLEISQARSTMNPRVGNWQGPYEMSTLSPSSRPGKSNRFWRSSVMKRVKAAPARRSTSCLASTASDSLRLGVPRCAIAWCSSCGFSEENLARLMTRRGLAALQTSTTSKEMFSPSRSQSSQRTSQCAFFASRSSCSLRFHLLSGTRLTILWSNSSTGWHPCHLRAGPSKSISMRCPVTEVKTMLEWPAPLTLYWNIHSGLYWDGPLLELAPPPLSTLEASLATVGFSATLRTTTIVVGHRRSGAGGSTALRSARGCLRDPRAALR